MEHAKLTRRIDFKSIFQFVGNIPFATAGSVGCAIVLMWYSDVPLHFAAIWVWFAALLALCGLRLYWAWSFSRRWRRLARRPRLAKWHWVAAEGLLGLVWGLFGWVHPETSNTDQFLYLTIIAGLTGGAAIAFAPLMPVMVAFTVSSFAPLIAHYWMAPNSSSAALSAVAILYGSLMVLLAGKLNSNIMATLRATYDNKRLFEELKRSNRQVVNEAALQQLASEQLRASKTEYENLSNEYASMLETMPIGVVKLDARLRATYMNTAIKKMLGVPQHEQSKAIGRDVSQLPTIRMARLEGYLAALAKNQTFQFEGEYTSLYGKKLDVSVRGLPLAKDEKFHEGILIVEDISERVQRENELRDAKEEAQSANRAKTAFLSNMGHELRTPIHGIMGMVDVLEASLADDETREYLRVIRISSANLLESVNRILDIARIESGKFVLAPSLCDPRALVLEEAGVFRSPFQKKGIDFQVHVADSVPVAVLADEERLREILKNLISNALKFTEHGNVRVEVSARVVNDRESAVRFSISDTGIGISPSDQAKLFESFRQADASASRRYQGMGLGITIARELIRLMGGELKLVSTVGVGSSFSFILPLPVTQGSVNKGNDPIAASILLGQRPSILVVDDNTVNRLIAVKFLQREGCEVDVASSGLEALEKVAKKNYDVVLMDIDMPEMDGLETMRHIRKLYHGSSMKIIAMTAHSMAGDEQRLLSEGMDDYLAKPFDRQSLHNMVAKYAPVPNYGGD